MKISPRDAESRLSNPDPAIRAYLIYGPDRGLVRERANRLAANLLDDVDDPFALTQLTEDDLKSDPAGFVDALCAMSLTGGKRLVRVRLSGETGSGPILDALKDIESGSLTPEAVALVESGDLTPRGKLRKSFEPAKNAATIACYADDARSLADLVNSSLTRENLRIAPDALVHWLPRLEGDRAMARGEIDKLIFYKGVQGQRQDGDDEVSLADIDAVSADHGDAAIDAVLLPLFDGEVAQADSAYARAIASGQSAVGLLRAMQRRIDQFGSVEAAGGGDTAIMRSGAPRFGPAADAFKRQMRFWSGRRLEAARQLVFDAERAVKRSGSPAEALVGQLILRLSTGTARQRRR